MVVGIVYLELFIPQAGSLKEKRSVLCSLKQKIRKKFNVSITEVEYLDKWQRAALGVGIVNTERAHLDSVLSELETFIARDHRVTITHWELRLV